MKELLERIERALPEGGDWCNFEKASTLAALVVGLRPQAIVEIGVWLGGSLVPMLMALHHTRSNGRALAIDPWAPQASLVGADPVNAAWWATADHEAAYRAFLARLDRHGVANYCNVLRQRSDDVEPPAVIDLMHIDGNHNEQAVRDVERFGPSVRVGGIAVLDDVGWVGGHVSRAIEIARELGFAELYPLDTGVVMQRRRGGP